MFQINQFPNVLNKFEMINNFNVTIWHSLVILTNLFALLKSIQRVKFCRLSKVFLCFSKTFLPRILWFFLYLSFLLYKLWISIYFDEHFFISWINYMNTVLKLYFNCLMFLSLFPAVSTFLVMVLHIQPLISQLFIDFWPV